MKIVFSTLTLLLASCASGADTYRTFVPTFRGHTCDGPTCTLVWDVESRIYGTPSSPDHFPDDCLQMTTFSEGSGVLWAYDNIGDVQIGVGAPNTPPMYLDADLKVWDYCSDVGTTVEYNITPDPQAEADFCRWSIKFSFGQFEDPYDIHSRPHPKTNHIEGSTRRVLFIVTDVATGTPELFTENDIVIPSCSN